MLDGFPASQVPASLLPHRQVIQSARELLEAAVLEGEGEGRAGWRVSDQAKDHFGLTTNNVQKAFKWEKTLFRF